MRVADGPRNVQQAVGSERSRKTREKHRIFIKAEKTLCYSENTPYNNHNAAQHPYSQNCYSINNTWLEQLWGADCRDKRYNSTRTHGTTVLHCYTEGYGSSAKIESIDNQVYDQTGLVSLDVLPVNDDGVRRGLIPVTAAFLLTTATET